MNGDRARGLPVILVTLLVAFMLAIWPLPGWAEPFRPAWVPLIALYWCMALPYRFAVGWSWATGLLLDVLFGSLLGTHALAMAMLAFVAIQWHLPVRVYPLWQQSLAIGVLLALYEFLVFWIDGIAGAPVPLSWHLAPLPLSVLLWPWVFNLLRVLRRRYQVS